ncbi:uncharacterized protein LOC143770005 isoform X2 [Ranitomeya variabilis]|uniref:uncharacterized protein LOC143770005 isoform X2 n=1 Tax=Ranitomeya variabilis TaxID=490064 RepID=UPI0040578441
MKSENQRAIHPAVINIPSADVIHRADSRLLQIAIQRSEVIEVITNMEESMKSLKEEIQETIVILEEILEETAKPIDDEDKMQENIVVIENTESKVEEEPTKSRLRSFFSCFCCFRF